MTSHLDFHGNVIRIGDTVIYTEAGAGRRLPRLEIGEVIKLTKAGVSVRRLHKDGTYQQYQDGFFRPTGKMIHPKWGSPYEETEYVKTNMVDKPPENIKYFEDRFIIVEKP
jgi:hypothetical protein